MNKEKYLQKIKKLLNKARNNSSEHEAAAALRMAQKLMREHGVGATDVELMDITTANSKGAPSDAVKFPNYVALLANAIFDAFGIEGVISWRYTASGQPKRIIKFYGPNERPEVAAYAFDVLSRQLCRARAEFISGMRKNIKSATKTARADAYCEAWVVGVRDSLTAFACTEAEKTLMAAYKARYFASAPEASGRAVKKAKGVDDAFYAGYFDGRQVELHQGVGSAGRAASPAQIGRA
ncbi:DUF2786 domain-containing protein [Edwardsiella hoshinae]|uniref:Protein of uncharacterized function (DUF2786) n=3 Tax=Edwardsiella hoshinae TaxID=93378 RepID=A0A376D7G9_9GAMM|nr:DUF2786 domain-containing protein [Edwardsiella hoshinae]QPR28218.1 DUF2786 domain-containing protein [Edwardsiella hoshinae]STC84360.1 Protein of uncharacterised function (DUF2786) [Edwardsiella hoshinae]